jgi:hypothetical protein
MRLLTFWVGGVDADVDAEHVPVHFTWDPDAEVLTIDVASNFWYFGNAALCQGQHPRVVAQSRGSMEWSLSPEWVSREGAVLAAATFSIRWDENAVHHRTPLIQVQAVAGFTCLQVGQRVRPVAG